MKVSILFASFLLAAHFLQAQKSTPVYVISSPENQANWLNIQAVTGNKAINLQTVYDFATQHPVLVDIENGQQRTKSAVTIPTYSTVAAAAFDAKTKRMFFAPLRIAELRWVDVSNSSRPQFYSISGTALSQLNLNDAANHITRMTMAADGFGYALTNDGKHLFRFTTDKKPILVDLGSLTDVNDELSVHNQSSSWGGDMIGGTDGLLYLVTYKQHVFKIDPVTLKSSYVGHIKGLPENYTVNGVAVDENGKVLITCSYGNQPFYKFDLDNLSAELAYTAEQRINASDLASSNLALRPAINNGQYVQGRSPFETANQKISMYPNPVTEYRFQLNFEETTTGIHTIQVMDLSGKLLMNKIVTISGPGQFEGVELNKKISKGMYFVKVLNSELKAVYTSKFILQ